MSQPPSRSCIECRAAMLLATIRENFPRRRWDSVNWAGRTQSAWQKPAKRLIQQLLTSPRPPSSPLSTQIGYFSGALDLSAEVLPELLGVSKDFLTGEIKEVEQAIKEWSVKRRANNPFARMLSPKNYKRGKDGEWEWCGKGTGSMLDGSLPYGD